MVDLFESYDDARTGERQKLCCDLLKKLINILPPRKVQLSASRSGRIGFKHHSGNGTQRLNVAN